MINNNRSASILVQSPPFTIKRKSHSRNVSFNTMAEVCVLDPALLSDGDDIENIDPSELWWQARDYKNIKRRCKYEARRRDDETLDDSDCSRGLERLMDGGECRTAISKAVYAVRKEQARHRLDGDFEDADISLAKVYASYCMHSAFRAERHGREDAVEAMIAIRYDWKSISDDVDTNNNNRDNNIGLHRHSKNSQKSITTKAQTQCHSLERIPFRENFKIALTNIISRRRHAMVSPI